MAAFAAMFVFIWTLTKKNFIDALMAGVGAFLFCALREWFYMLAAFSSLFAIMENISRMSF